MNAADAVTGPAAPARIAAGDGLVAHDAGGQCEAVLWLHPYTMDSTALKAVWRSLPGWRHIGLDLPGHGASRPLAPDDDLDRLAEVIARFAEREGVRHLVGVSFGTIAALQAAIARPDGFASLVLAAPGLAGGPVDPAVERRYLELAALYRAEGAGPHMTALWMRSPPDIFLHVARRPELAGRLASIIDRHGWSELRGYAMRGLASPAQGRAALERITAATLIVLGEHELPVHRTCAGRIAEAVVDARIAWVRGAGHLAVLEEPDAAAALISAHLAAATAQASAAQSSTAEAVSRGIRR